MVFFLLVLNEKIVEEISDLAEQGIEISIDLEEQQLIAQNKLYKFDIDPYRKHCLLNGLDDIGINLENKETIDYTREVEKIMFGINPRVFNILR